jgi:hypothetical protein
LIPNYIRSKFPKVPVAIVSFRRKAEFNVIISLLIHTELYSIFTIMKIAVTGCSGSVGSRVVLAALDHGHSVLGLDQAPPRLSTPLPSAFSFKELDLRDFDATLNILRGCDAVAHLAAHRNPTDYLVKSHNEYVLV